MTRKKTSKKTSVRKTSVKKKTTPVKQTGKQGLKQTKFDFQVSRCRTPLLKGKVLVIDPSSGSQSSLPGYALFEAGSLKEVGVLSLNIGRELGKRLQELSIALRDFGEVDVLVVEDIPVRSFGKGARPHASLLKAVGCVLGSVSYKYLVEVSPSTWKAYLRKNEGRFTDYKKSDDWDALVMGLCSLDLAANWKEKTYK